MTIPTNSAPTRERVVQLYNAAVKKRAAMPENEKGPVPVWLFEEGMAVARAGLEAKVTELEAEVTRLTTEHADISLVSQLHYDQNLSLRQQLAASQEENARLKAECDDIKQVQFPRKVDAVAAGWRKQLAAEQLRNERLRRALNELVQCKNLKSEIEAIRFAGPVGYHGENWNEAALEKEREYIKRKPEAWIVACETLSEPHDTAALDAYVAEQIKKAQLKEPQ